MTQIVEVIGVGDVEFPDGMSQGDIAQALKKLPTPKTAPTSTTLQPDVPLVASQMPKQIPVAEPKRGMMDYVKALGEVPATMASGMIAQPVGAAYGVAKGMLGPKTPQAMQEAQQAGGQLAQKLQYQPTSPVSQDVLQGIGSAMETAKIPPYMGNIGAIPSAIQAGNVAKPMMQADLQAIKPAVNQMAQALRREPGVDYKAIAKGAPTAESLATESSNLFKAAKESGVELNAKDFATNMASVTKDLRNEGYDPRLYPKLAVAVEELTNAQIPKDFNELSTLRKFIRNAQKSTDPDEKRLATTLKEDFDAYVSTIPESSVVGGSKQGLADWKQARDSYSKLSKSEIFTDMLEKAELDKSKFTQSGAENALASQLRRLAKNDKQMRLFTSEEQDAIKAAAKGGTMQNLLKFYGRFSPTGPVSGIFAGGAMLAHPAVAIPLELGAVAARAGATKMRKDSVERLAALMRAGMKKGNENE